MVMYSEQRAVNTYETMKQEKQKSVVTFKKIHWLFLFVPFPTEFLHDDQYLFGSRSSINLKIDERYLPSKISCDPSGRRLINTNPTASSLIDRRFDLDCYAPLGTPITGRALEIATRDELDKAEVGQPLRTNCSPFLISRKVRSIDVTKRSSFALFYLVNSETLNNMVDTQQRFMGSITAARSDKSREISDVVSNSAGYY